MHKHESTTNNEQLVSVVVTCYNDGLYIDETLKSIAASTLVVTEVIIVDDCSNDLNTISRLDELEKIGYMLIRKEANKGISHSRNEGIRKATGSIILTVDADDLIHPDYLKKAVPLIKEGYDIVYCNVKNFGSVNSVRIAPDFSLPLLLAGNFIASSSVFKKSVWEKSQGYDLKLECYEDWEFWIQVAINGGRFAHINEVLFDYRRKEISLNSRCSQPAIRAEMVRYISKKHSEVYKVYVTEIAASLHQVISSLEMELKELNTLTAEGNTVDLLARAKTAEMLLEQRTAYYENSFFWKLKKITQKLSGR